MVYLPRQPNLWVLLNVTMHPCAVHTKVISEELKGVTSNRAIILQMAVKAANDTAGPNGLVPTLLVFGAYPRLSDLDPPSPTITQKTVAIKKAMREVDKLAATRRITDALRQRNGPRVEHIHDLNIGSDVLVWRVHEKARPVQASLSRGRNSYRGS